MKHRKKGSFVMQHQSQGFENGTAAGTTGIFDQTSLVSSAEIERHIARGKRMQAEAIAAFFRGGFRRLALLIQHDRKSGRDGKAGGLPMHGDNLSRA
jgi:hypothetical protein